MYVHRDTKVRILARPAKLKLAFVVVGALVTAIIILAIGTFAGKI
jgi:hypothetical protein